jgi:hypothetical protein
MTRRLTPRRGFGRPLGALCLLVAIGMVSAGCGRSKTGHVSGTVYTADGKPLPGGTVVFYPTEGSKALPSTAEIGEDGNYDMKNAPVGKVKVTVSNRHLKEGIPPPVGMGGGAPMPPRGGRAPSMGPPKDVAKDQAPPPKTTAPQAPGKYVPIPDKYGKPETSELDFEVKPGSQKHDITLK